MTTYETITNLLASRKPNKREVLLLLSSLPGVTVTASPSICKVLAPYKALKRHVWSSVRDVYGIELTACSRCGLIRVKPYSSVSHYYYVSGPKEEKEA